MADGRSLPGQETDRLWACHQCKRIGSKDGARDHAEQTGHTSEQLPQDTSDAVRAAWSRQDAERVVGLMMFARARTLPSSEEARDV